MVSFNNPFIRDSGYFLVKKKRGPKRGVKGRLRFPMIKGDFFTLRDLRRDFIQKAPGSCALLPWWFCCWYVFFSNTPNRELPWKPGSFNCWDRPRISSVFFSVFLYLYWETQSLPGSIKQIMKSWVLLIFHGTFVYLPIVNMIESNETVGKYTKKFHWFPSFLWDSWDPTESQQKHLVFFCPRNCPFSQALIAVLQLMMFCCNFLTFGRSSRDVAPFESWCSFSVMSREDVFWSRFEQVLAKLKRNCFDDSLTI